MENKKSSAKKVLSVIGNIIIWLFVIFAVAMTLLAFAAQSSADGVPSIGGNAILTVRTDSMKPTFSQGDIIISKKVTPDEAKELKVGDIITYSAGDLNADGTDDLNSHRIYDVITDENGEILFRTQGDNNSYQDPSLVKWSDVICKFDETNGIKIGGVGSVIAFLQTPTGFLVCIVLPLLVFFIIELIIFIRKLVSVKNAGKKQITEADEELIRQRAVEEYIRAQQENGEPKAEEKPAEEKPVEETPAEEAPAEEKPAEETPAEEPATEDKSAE